MGGVIWNFAPRYCERAIKLGVTKMDERIAELEARIARLEALIAERQYDTDFVFHAQHQMVAYAARVAVLRAAVGEHFLGVMG